MSHVSFMLKKIARIIKKRWYIALILLAVGGYFIYQATQNKSKGEDTTYTVKRQTLQEILALSGEVNASEIVNLHFQSSGRLSWVGVKEGDYVEKNQGIASLDQRQLQKTLEKYLNTYSSTRADFEQTTDDNDQLTIALSQDVRDRASRLINQEQANLSNAVLDVELQTISKEYAYLFTPISGIVTRVDTPNAGMNVTFNDIYQVINPDTMYFGVTADQTEVVKLFNGQPGTITLDAFPDGTVAGSITAISFTPKTDETGTVYEVKMMIDPAQAASYRLGMTGDVEFILDEIPNAISIPFEYIEETDDNNYVYKKVGDKKEKVEVKTGTEYDGIVQITDGLYEGDVIYEVPE